MTAEVVFVYYMEAKLESCSPSDDIFNCPSRFPQAVQTTILIPYRKVIGPALHWRSNNLCASTFLPSSKSINNAVFPWQLTSRRNKTPGGMLARIWAGASATGICTEKDKYSLSSPGGGQSCSLSSRVMLSCHPCKYGTLIRSHGLEPKEFHLPGCTLIIRCYFEILV